MNDCNTRSFVALKMLKTAIFALFLVAVLPRVHGGLKRTYHDNFFDRFVDPYPFCGHRFITGDPHEDYVWKLFWLQKRVVGGKESKPGSWPWQVALLFKGTQSCAGSLINEQWVVTAAHCFHDAYSSTNPKHWSATLGEHKLNDKEEFEQVRDIQHIIMHPNYSFPYFQGIFDAPPDYDVALIKLARPARITNFVYPICLLRPNQIFRPGKKCYVTGWGHTKFNGSRPPALNEAVVKIVAMQACNKELSYSGKIPDRAFCAGYAKGGVDACQYDSGGPLSCVVDEQYYLTGLVSWGQECARPHKYGVYSNMAVLTPWVVKTIEQFEANKHHHRPYY